MRAERWRWPTNLVTPSAKRLRCCAWVCWLISRAITRRAWPGCSGPHQVDPAAMPGRTARECSIYLAKALREVPGEVGSALQTCAQALAGARQAGAVHQQTDCLQLMADLDLQTGRLPEARAHLRAAIEIALRIPDRYRLIECVDIGGHLLLAAAVFAHESAAFGVQVLAGAGGDVRPGGGAGAGSGCAEEAGERGDGFEQQGVEAGLLVGGAAGAELGDGAAVLGLGGELPDAGGHGGVFQGGRAARRDAASRG